MRLEQRGIYGESIPQISHLSVSNMEIAQDAESNAWTLVSHSPEISRSSQIHREWARFSSKILLAGLHEAGIIDENTDMSQLSEIMAKLTDEAIRIDTGEL